MRDFSKNNLISKVSGIQFVSISINALVFSSSIEVIKPKLNRSNFRVLSSQVLSTIGVYDLSDHLLGFLAYPALFIQVRTIILVEESSVT